MTRNPSTPLYEKMADTATVAWKLKLDLQEHAINKSRELWEDQKKENEELHKSSVKLHARQRQLNRFRSTSHFLQIATNAASLSLALLSGNPIAIALGAISLSATIVSSVKPSKSTQAIQLVSSTISVIASLQNPINSANLLTKSFNVLIRSSQGINSIGVASSTVYKEIAQADVEKQTHNSQELTKHIDRVLKDSTTTTACYSVERQLLAMTAKLSHAASSFSRSDTLGGRA